MCWISSYFIHTLDIGLFTLVSSRQLVARRPDAESAGGRQEMWWLGYGVIQRSDFIEVFISAGNYYCYCYCYCYDNLGFYYKLIILPKQSILLQTYLTSKTIQRVVTHRYPMKQNYYCYQRLVTHMVPHETKLLLLLQL